MRENSDPLANIPDEINFTAEMGKLNLVVT